MARISLFPGTALILAVLILPGRSYGAPGDVLFSDDFERATLSPWTTTDASISGILTGAQVSNSPTRGGYTSNSAVTVTSASFSVLVPAADLDIWVRRGSDAFSEDTDNGENLVLEYRRSDSSWGTLFTYVGSGTPGQIFQDTFQLPPDALHGNFAVRLRQTNGSGFDWDYWHWDDVIVTERVPPPPFGVGSCDDFEFGLAGNWTINATTGSAGTSTDTFQSPTRSMFTGEGIVEVTSRIIDATDPAFSTLSLWIQRGSDAFSEDPDGGEDLVVEYLDDSAAWISLETFAGSGSAGQIYNRSYSMPVDARHVNFQIRIRQTGGSGAGWDFWHVDDVCLNSQLLPELLVTKSLQTLSDPVNGSTNPFSIPGAIVEYTINVANNGPGTVDADTLLITDVVPPDTELFVDTSGGDPIVFVDGATPSGLTYSYAGSVSFSNQAGGGPPFNYVPVAGAAGFDPAVTGFQISFSGTMSAAGGGNSPDLDLLFQLRVQ